MTFEDCAVAENANHCTLLLDKGKRRNQPTLVCAQPDAPSAIYSATVQPVAAGFEAGLPRLH
jgi:hypothetical protein